MRNTVGISHRLKRAWLDDLLDRLVQTTEEKELRAFVDQRLRDELPGKEARAKASGIILRIWCRVEPKHAALRNRAVALLPRISPQERLWLHWGMTELAYPFFRDLAEVIGRMLTLQDDFATAQVQARMKTAWGDRATSKEAVQKLITGMVDWEVLRATKTKGHFLLARKMTTTVTDLQLWLLEAMLSASASDEIEAQQLLRLPEAFPFAFTVTMGDVRKHAGFQIHRQGLDMDMVAVRQLTAELPPRPSANQRRSRASDQVQLSFVAEPTEQVLPNDNPLFTSPVIPVLKPEHGQAQTRVAASVIERSAQSPSDPAVASGECISSTMALDLTFEASRAECNELLRAGHYLGCIALAQSLLEVMVERICQVHTAKGPSQEVSFEKSLDTLHERRIIGGRLRTKLSQMWRDRSSVLLLDTSVASERQRLEETARNNLKLIQELERTLAVEEMAQHAGV